MEATEATEARSPRRRRPSHRADRSASPSPSRSIPPPRPDRERALRRHRPEEPEFLLVERDPPRCSAAAARGITVGGDGHLYIAGWIEGPESTHPSAILPTSSSARSPATASNPDGSSVYAVGPRPFELAARIWVGRFGGALDPTWQATLCEWARTTSLRRRLDTPGPRCHPARRSGSPRPSCMERRRRPPCTSRPWSSWCSGPRSSSS